MRKKKNTSVWNSVKFLCKIVFMWLLILSTVTMIAWMFNVRFMIVITTSIWAAQYDAYIWIVNLPIKARDSLPYADWFRYWFDTWESSSSRAKIIFRVINTFIKKLFFSGLAIYLVSWIYEGLFTIKLIPDDVIRKRVIDTLFHIEICVLSIYFVYFAIGVSWEYTLLPLTVLISTVIIFSVFWFIRTLRIEYLERKRNSENFSV